MAIVYNVQRISIKYKIVSENKFNVLFIPLYENWSLSARASGMSWFQTYNIYGKQLPVPIDNSSSKDIKTEISECSIDISLQFMDYLKILVKKTPIIRRMFQNMIEPDSVSIVLFRASILRYAEAHKDELTNCVDKFCVESLIDVLHKESFFERGEDEFIEQTFSVFGNNKTTDR